MNSNASTDRSVLPNPDRKPVGLTTYDAKDPETRFPPITPLRPPAGAPNVLIILLDDVGFGASSAFGGPCQTPTAEAEKLMAIKWRNYKIHLDSLERVDGAFEDSREGSTSHRIPKERFNIIWQNIWIGERIGPFIVAYQASVKKYPNLAGGCPITDRRATEQRMLPPRQAQDACNTSWNRYSRIEIAPSGPD